MTEPSDVKPVRGPLKSARPMPRRAEVREVEKPLIEDVPSEPVSEKPFVYKPGALVKPLTSLYETLGGFVLLGDKICGEAIINSARQSAESLDELARTNPKVRKVLVSLVTTNAWSKVIIAHLPIFMAVLGHHFPKMLPYLFNLVKPAEV